MRERGCFEDGPGGVRYVHRLKLPANHCAQPPPPLSVLMGGADNLLSAPRAEHSSPLEQKT